jgi:hypothetical protein
MATTPTVQPPASTDIAIPQPPPREQEDQEQLYRHLAQSSKAGQFNATLQRQERAALLAIYGKTALVQTAIQAAVKDTTVIASPPTQANVQALQASVNAAITQLNLVITQLNALTGIVGPLLDAVNANLKSLPATS